MPSPRRTAGSDDAVTRAAAWLTGAICPPCSSFCRRKRIHRRSGLDLQFRLRRRNFGLRGQRCWQGFSGVCRRGVLSACLNAIAADRCVGDLPVSGGVPGVLAALRVAVAEARAFVHIQPELGRSAEASDEELAQIKRDLGR